MGSAALVAAVALPCKATRISHKGQRSASQWTHLSERLPGGHEEAEVVVTSRVQVHLQVGLRVFESVAVVGRALSRCLQFDRQRAFLSEPEKRESNTVYRLTD